MAYVDLTDDNFIEDLLTRKEFYWTKRWDPPKNTDDEIIPRFVLDDAIQSGNFLKLSGHQQFISNFLNPNTEFKRLHLKWSTGSGKTIGGLAVAMNFINQFKMERELGSVEIGSVFIIGYAKRQFQADLLRFPEFGFISYDERIKLHKLRKLAHSGALYDADKLREFVTMLKKRFTNRKFNGFFQFYGYKEFVTRILNVRDFDLNEMNEAQIHAAIADNTITYNTALLSEFKNSIIICDEIHNVYNSAEKNNWGIALQAVLDKEPSCRCLTLSATPFNNSPAEFVSLLNLLLPADQRVNKSLFFTSNNSLKPGALSHIAQLSRGRFSFLIDANPANYPQIISEGASIPGIDYLKFIRAPMSQEFYATYKRVYDEGMPIAGYLDDIMLDNPDNENIGIYQPDLIRKLAAAPSAWKEKHGLDFQHNKIVGAALGPGRLHKISAKYAAVIDAVMDVIQTRKGKIFIYHNDVHMSGVLFIEQVLIAHGFIDEFSASVANTLCMRCGKPKSDHATQQNTEHTGGAGDKRGTLRENSSLPEGVDLYGDTYKVTSHDILNARQPLTDEFLSMHPRKIRYEHAEGAALTAVLKHAGYTRYKKTALYIHMINAEYPKVRQVSAESEPDPHNAAEYSGGKQPQGPPSGEPCAFAPARFIMAHSDIDRRQMDASLDKYNDLDNVTGVKYLILVGSKIIKESYDLKAIQNVFIAGRPDNIPTFIQIRGRAVRNKSHRGLPADSQVVRVKIFVHQIPGKTDKLSHEELKYQEKIESFKVIQQIEQVIHENAIDSTLNYDKIKRSIISDPLAPLPYKPIYTTDQLDISQLNQSTFDPYYGDNEIHLIKSLIKRIFISLSSVWQYSDLLEAVRNPPDNFENEINTELFSEDNFKIALQQLIYYESQNTVEPFIKHLSHTTSYTTQQLSHTTEKVTGGYQYRHNGNHQHRHNANRHNGNHQNRHNANRHNVPQNIAAPLDYIQYGDYYTDPVPFAPLPVNGGETLGDLETDDKQCMFNNTTCGGGSQDNSPSKLDFDTTIRSMFDTNDKVIIMPNGQQSIIVALGEFYIMFPMLDGKLEMDIDACYRTVTQARDVTININSFMQTKRVDFDYEDKRKIFYRKYSDTAIENMENVICEYGALFHHKFIEECVTYVFNAWTANVEKSEYHEFYFKMLYYYDLLSLVMWVYTSKPRITADYSQYAIPVKAKDIKLRAMKKYNTREAGESEDISPEDNSDLASSGVINLLKSTLNRTSNMWIPQEFRVQFAEIVAKSLALYDGKKKRSKLINKVSAELLPIGHFIGKFPRIYHPVRGWEENPSYAQNETEYIENNIIIGFDERSSTGIHIRFKLRNPIHAIKKHKDSRETEKGTVCKSKSKPFLIDIAKKLKIEFDESNVEDLCVLIRSKLIRNELKERILKTNIKYFYFHYEQRPETT